MKAWYQSKTIIFNILTVILAIIQGMSGQAWISPELQVTIVAIINAILRLLTKTEIVK